MDIKMHQVTALPATLDPDSFYFVLNGNYAESYLTDNSGVAKHIGNSQMIMDLAQSLIDSDNQVVADIASRDAISSPNVGDLVLVIDASADVTVDSGAATYVWDGSAYVKISEYESLDLIVNWSDIVGKPTSTPSAIDQAVTDSHTHVNKTELDKIGEDGDGCLTYNGVAIDKWTTNNW